MAAVSALSNVPEKFEIKGTHPFADFVSPIEGVFTILIAMGATKESIQPMAVKALRVGLKIPSLV